MLLRTFIYEEEEKKNVSRQIKIFKTKMSFSSSHRAIDFTSLGIRSHGSLFMVWWCFWSVLEIDSAGPHPPLR